MNITEIGCTIHNLREPAQEAIRTLKCLGVKFNIVKRVQFRTELFFETTNLKGATSLRFVAELDDYGNVVWDDGPTKPVSDIVFNADGERV